MATKSLPVRGDIPNYEFLIELDKKVYGFEFQWNERCSCWTFDLKDQTGLVLMGGIQVTVNWLVLDRFKDASFPPGMLFFWDTGSPQGQGVDPQQISDLGSRVILLYQEAGT